MSANRRLSRPLACITRLILAATAAGADNRRDPQQRDTLQSVLGRIHDHAAGEGAASSRAQDCIFISAEAPDVRLPGARANTTRSVKISTCRSNRCWSTR